MKLELVIVPYDSGHRGERLGEGPGSLAPFLADGLADAGHELEVREIRLPDAFYPEVEAAVALQERVHHAVRAARAEGHLPVVLAGNCNGAAFGCVSALGGEAGIVWFDAHGDFNTPETSASGYFDGMSLALLVGRGWPGVRRRLTDFQSVGEDSVLFVGGRDLEPAERDLLASSAIAWVRETDIGSGGLEPPLAALSRRVAEIYLHVDLDVLDPSALEANPWACPGGLSLDELVAAVAAMARQLRVGALALTAYGPSYDIDHRGPTVAREVVLAALGEGG